MNNKLKNIDKVFWAFLTAVVLFFIFIFAALGVSFGNVNGRIYTYLLLAIGILLETAIIGALWGFLKKKHFWIPLCIAFGVCIAAWFMVSGYQNYIDNMPTVVENKNLLASYAPYAEHSKTAALNEKSELTITENLPVMDGATALYPIYSGFAKAVYPKELLDDIVVWNGNVTNINQNEFLKCTTTTEAYHNIVTGDADIIFAAPPSEEQKQFAKENGVKLVYTPIGKEAFVFFVNAKNPIENITVEEIQKIYSGEITDWGELGVQKLGEIKAFQRDKGSGSQSTLEHLMAGKMLMTPPKKDVIDGMGGIIEKTADYKNFKNAIGYSFRFYATEMVKDNRVKLLGINGIFPNLENIENGQYPLASYFYAVTRSDADKNTLKLLEWIQGEQGQKIIEMTGYTPLGK